MKQLVLILIASLFFFGCSKQKEKSVKADKNIRILFAGDTSFGENYRGGMNILKSKGYDYSINKLVPFLKNSDMVIANLETPVTNLRSSPLHGKKRYIHWSDIEKTPKNLIKNNIKTVSLANNHTMDYGIKGLKESLDILKSNGIEYFGAGRNETEASIPFRFNSIINGKEINFIVAAGFEYIKDYDKKFNFYANQNSGGVNAWNETNAFNQIKALRDSDDKAFIIAYPHWWKNYSWKSEDQTKLAHRMIDAGADLVIGHGAHKLQEIEEYKGRWIIYSLGNFLFNTYGRYQQKKAPPFSLIAKLEISQRNYNPSFLLKLYPIVSDNRITKFQPRPVTKNEFNYVQKLVLTKSSKPKQLQKRIKIGNDSNGMHFILTLRSVATLKR